MSTRRDRQIHPLAPIVDEQCEILILGSFPSVKSREVQFYYGHPRNRFWKMMAQLLECDEPVTNEEKRKMLLEHHIALWDTIHSCTIVNSADDSIQDVVPNDIAGLIESTQIKRIICNGKASYRYYHISQESSTKIKAEVLPSTSPANAAYSMERLIENWKTIIKTPF